MGGWAAADAEAEAEPEVEPEAVWAAAGFCAADLDTEFGAGAAADGRASGGKPPPAPGFPGINLLLMI